MRSAPRSGQGLTRRETLGLAAAWQANLIGEERQMSVLRAPEAREGEIAARVRRTHFVDTHEHLVEEPARTHWQPTPLLPCNDWALLFSHYIDSDLMVAGMPPEHRSILMSPEKDTAAKWEVLEPWWPAVRNTGYGQAVELAASTLYGIRSLNGTTVRMMAERYTATVKPGFYRRVLRDLAGIESCQVNSLERTFMQSQQPALLMQDISILNLHTPEAWQGHAQEAGIRVSSLADYHRVVDWYFATYGPYAVAVKSQSAYSRELDFQDVPAEAADPIFRRILNGEHPHPQERRKLEDHLFWYCVRKATEYRLPVKLHTGYYAGHNGMPLARVAGNPGHVTELLRRAPETTFVLMHICYPFHEQMVALAKHWHNAVVDMCWSWIINPEAATQFLRSFLMAAPSSKILTFGGDYIPVEPVIGHAMIARHGITLALNGLVRDGWLTQSAAIDLVEPLMRGNARRIFMLDEKEKVLANAPWLHKPISSARS